MDLVGSQVRGMSTWAGAVVFAETGNSEGGIHSWSIGSVLSLDIRIESPKATRGHGDAVQKTSDMWLLVKRSA